MYTLGKAKVGNFDCRIIVRTLQQKILRLEVPMGDMIVVAVSDSINDNFASISGFFFVVICLGNDPVKELSSRHVLHHEVEGGGFFEKVIETNDVVMFKFCENGNLLQQCRCIFLRQLRPIHALHREGRFAIRTMLSFSHRRKRTRSKHTLEAIDFREAEAGAGVRLRPVKGILLFKCTRFAAGSPTATLGGGRTLLCRRGLARMSGGRGRLAVFRRRGFG
mmetsp:Transcript_6310/g.11221  ORF Transcript_6310/g.11221 Transcript_6310/m.11221 type:complete len:221 (+) Transcript_6310:897-1559(+)